MTGLNTASVVTALENMIAEKEALAAQELELLSGIKQALNRLGYDLLPLEPELTAPRRRTRKASEISSEEPAVVSGADVSVKKRRGRPRKNSLSDPSVPATATLPNGSDGFASEHARDLADLPDSSKAVYEDR